MTMKAYLVKHLKKAKTRACLKHINLDYGQNAEHRRALAFIHRGRGYKTEALKKLVGVCTGRDPWGVLTSKTIHHMNSNKKQTPDRFRSCISVHPFPLVWEGQLFVSRTCVCGCTFRRFSSELWVEAERVIWFACCGLEWGLKLSPVQLLQAETQTC